MSDNKFKIEILKADNWETLDLRGKKAEFTTEKDAQFVFEQCGFQRHTDRARIVPCWGYSDDD